MSYTGAVIVLGLHRIPLVRHANRLNSGLTSTSPALARRRTAIRAALPCPMSCHRSGDRTAYFNVARIFLPRRTFLPDGLSVVMRLR